MGDKKMPRENIKKQIKKTENETNKITETVENIKKKCKSLNEEMTSKDENHKK